jgi:hypothetical protein
MKLDCMAMQCNHFFYIPKCVVEESQIKIKEEQEEINKNVDEEYGPKGLDRKKEIKKI